MDRSLKFFDELNVFEKKIKKITQQNYQNTDLLTEALLEKSQYIMKKMTQAIHSEGYHLIVEDIARFLDLDEKQVRANIIPYLDYIRVPEGAADFFTIEQQQEMSFLEMRIKKWKRLFIQRESFDSFLERHLVLYCPYTEIQWSEKEMRHVAIGKGETALPYSHKLNVRLVRKCNIASIIRESKINDLIRKTKNDITHAKMLGLISSDRLKAEMAYLSECKDTLDVPVHNQEIKNYIEKHLHYKLHLYKEEEDKFKPLYTTQKKVDDEVRIKPTVLYWFIQ